MNFREANPEWDDALPGPNCEDLDEWTSLLEVLMDRVLWDRDFEEEELFLDADPDVSHFRKNQMGIGKDYFTAVAPEPIGDQLERIRETLRQLCCRPQRPDRQEPGKGEENPWF